MELVDRSLGRSHRPLRRARTGSIRTATRSSFTARTRRRSSTRASAVIPRRAALPRVDRVLNSHCHEDHVAGNHLFPDVAWHVHEARPARAPLARRASWRSSATTGRSAEAWRKTLVEQFHYVPRADAQRLRATAPSSSSAAACACARSTRRATRAATARSTSSPTASSTSATSISRASAPTTATRGPISRTSSARSRWCASIEARWYATFHHIGVLEGRAAFLERLDRFAAVIGRPRARAPRLPRRAAHPRRGRGAPLRLPARGPGALGRARSSAAAWASTSRGSLRDGARPRARAGTLPAVPGCMSAGRDGTC